MTIKAPYLPYDTLRLHADTFLEKYHPSRKPYVKIDEIIEYQIGLDIVPVPGLLDGYDVDGWLSKDRATIYVDEFVYLNRENRYRFSLAHEVAHWLVHKDIYDLLDFSSAAGWKQVLAEFPQSQLGFFEYQAYALGGLILVSADHLEAAFERLANDAFSAGVDIAELTREQRQPFDRELGKIFGVSPGVIARRLEKENLVEKDSD